jgi:hypothetical protein
MEQAGRRGEAIRWGRRGLTSMGTRFWQTQPLREFLSSLYLADGDEEAAEHLWWEDFRARPSVDTYRRLVAETRSSDPSEVGEQAIGELRGQVESGASHPAPRSWWPCCYTRAGQRRLGPRRSATASTSKPG